VTGDTEPAVSVVDVYTRCAGDYADHWGAQLTARGRSLVDAMDLRDARRVLDLGSGVGLNSDALRAAAPRAVVVNADGSEGMVRRAGGPRVVSDAHLLAFGDERFDAVLMAFVLHHLARPLVALREVRRVLRDAGRLAAGTWAINPDIRADRIWTEELEAAGAAPGPPFNLGFEATNSPDRVRSLMGEAGLTVERIDTHVMDDPMDVEGFLLRRTRMGVQGWRFSQIAPGDQVGFIERVRARLQELHSDDLNARETAILTWARR